MKKITDPTFRYVPSHQTNLKATFARIRREQSQSSPPRQENVMKMKRTVNR
jgi:hypothetical protein